MWISRSAVVVICVHISLEDFIQRSKQSLEAVSVQGYNLELCLGDDISCSWLILQQSQLSEIVSRLIMLHFLWWVTMLKCLGSDSLSLDDQIKDVSVFSLFNIF